MPKRVYGKGDVMRGPYVIGGGSRRVNWQTIFKSLWVPLALVLVVAVFSACSLSLLGESGDAAEVAPALQFVEVREVWVDVDGDGDLDLIVSGEVVLQDTSPFLGPSSSSSGSTPTK